jgi:hypothetical protein
MIGVASSHVLSYSVPGAAQNNRTNGMALDISSSFTCKAVATHSENMISG